MQILAVLSESAVSFLEEGALSKLFLVIQEVIDNVVVILHVLEFGSRDSTESPFPLDSNLFGHIFIVEDNTLFIVV